MASKAKKAGGASGATKARRLPVGSRPCVHCGGTGLQFDHKAVGETMRKKREQKGMMAQTVARLMGMAPSYLCGLEKGVRPWNQATVDRYEDALNGVSYRERVVGNATRAMEKAKG